MRIMAVSDVHSPRFFDEFVSKLSHHQPPDLLLMAGDMTNRGAVEEYPLVVGAIEEAYGTDFPIIACFGNEEYSEIRDRIISSIGNRATFLDEQSLIVNIQGLRIGVVGTQGSLDKPTTWQRRNLPRIKQIFERRSKRAESLLKRMRRKVDYRILLMHYSPCLETCQGEEERSFAWLGSRKFYSMITQEPPDLVIHGHVHNSVIHEAQIGLSLVRNVAFPAVGDLTELDLWA